MNDIDSFIKRRATEEALSCSENLIIKTELDKFYTKERKFEISKLEPIHINLDMRKSIL